MAHIVPRDNFAMQKLVNFVLVSVGMLWVMTSRTVTLYDITLYPRRGRRVKKHTVVCGTPAFLGVVGACACNRYQALSPPPSGPGYEANNYTDC